jgi:hypothetical protein
MQRKLSDEFMSALKEGELNAILKLVTNDDTLDLEIRDEYINIYYRGGSILKISSSTKKDFFDYHFDEKYAKQQKPYQESLNNTLNERDWNLFFPIAKQVMDLYFSKSQKSEREFQQLVVRENNYSPIANGTDYYIVDIEYDNHKNARFDLIGVEWQSEGSKRKLSGKYKPRLVLIEMKYGDKALTGNAGLEKHVDDIEEFLSNQQTVDDFKSEMIKLFDQKRKLGLIPKLAYTKGNNRNEVNEFAEEVDFAFLLANHDPASKKLGAELLNLSLTPSKDKIKIITANFMGYGIYKDNVFTLNEFIKRFPDQIRN